MTDASCTAVATPGTSARHLVKPPSAKSSTTTARSVGSASSSKGNNNHPRNNNNNNNNYKQPTKFHLTPQQLTALLKPFWIDVMQNHVKAVKKFLHAHVASLDLNAARYVPCADGTALHLCAQYGHVAMAQLLLDHGLDLNLQNKVGSTALHVACKFKQEPFVVFLLRKGAHVDIPDNVRTYVRVADG